MAGDPAAKGLTVGAIVLAAGLSRRMGSNKLLADLGGRPLVAHVVAAIAAAEWPRPIVVTGHDAAPIENALSGHAASFVHAEDHAVGLSRSIAAGVSKIPDDWGAVAICLGDMPLIRPATLRGLAEHARHDAIVVPAYAGRRGNPVLWGRRYFGSLRSLDGDAGGRGLFTRYATNVVEVASDDPAVLVDADTPEALADLRKNFVQGTD